MGRPKGIRVGIQVGYWLVLEDMGKRAVGKRETFYRYWRCRCTLCGVTESLVREYNLLKQNTKHCLKCNPGRPPINGVVKTGDKIGWWTVVRQVEGALDTKGRKSHRRFLCVCRCGKEQILRQTQLNRQGEHSSLSCGCGRRYHLAVTLMLKHENIMDPSVKAMFAEFRTLHGKPEKAQKERADGSERASGGGSNQPTDTGMVSVA